MATRGPLNSSAPTTSVLVGGVYNSVAPAPADQQECALQVDDEGNLLVNVAVGGGGGGGVVQIEDSSGNALNSNGSGALNVAVVSGGGSNASVGMTGTTAPTSATEVGIIVGGNLVGISSANPVPTSLPTGQAVELLDSGGTNKASISAAGALKVDGSAATQPVSGTVAVTQSTSPWIVAGGGTAGSPGTAVLTVQGIGGGTAIPVSGTFYQATQPVSIASGQVASGAFASGSIASGAIASGAIAAGAAAAGAFADGSIYVRSNAAATFPVTATIAAAQTIAVTQATASSLNATVVGTLTNNNAAPAATNVGVLPALANAANPSWSEGDQVLLSEDLSGHLRVVATGQVASGSSAAGNPVLVSGIDSGGLVRPISAVSTGGTGDGICICNHATAAADGNTNTAQFMAGISNVAIVVQIYPFQYNGSTWDRQRSAGVGNAVASTGLAASVPYVQYNTTLPAPTAGQYTAAQCDTVGSTYINTEGRKATYSAFASFTAVAGDIAVLPGSASNTIRIIRVEVSFTTSGVAAVEGVQLIKRSAADTGGTSSAMTAVPHDSGFAGASAVPLNYTVAPTPGAAVGAIRGVQFNDASSSVPGANTWIWDFGARPSSAIVLRGVAQMLCVNIPTAIATQTALVSFEWTEE